MNEIEENYLFVRGSTSCIQNIFFLADYKVNCLSTLRASLTIAVISSDSQSVKAP